MLYTLIRPIAKTAFRLNFRRIHMHGSEGIPWEKPLILAINHPTAFLEPCILACELPRPLNFLVRGDIWGKGFYNWLMRGVHLVPIYRIIDGYANLTKNYDTFNYCYSVLASKKPLVVLPEGSTVQEKRLRPLKKGVSKICFGAIEHSPGLDLHIVPIGVTFTQPNRSGSDALFEFGQPIRVQDYWEEYQENPNKGYLKLTRRLTKEMEALIVNIRSQEDDGLVEHALELVRSELPDEGSFFRINKANDRLRTERACADLICALPPEEKYKWRDRLEAYFSMLNRYGFQDRSVARPAKMTIGKVLFRLFGQLPSLIGKWLNAPPILLGKFISRTRVERIEFKMPVFLAVAMISWTLLFLAGLAAAFFIREAWFWALMAAIPTLGVFHIYYRYRSDHWPEADRYSRLPENARKTLSGAREALHPFLDLLLAKETEAVNPDPEAKGIH